MDQEQNWRVDAPTPRWLIAPYAALAGWIGTAYVFGDPVRTSTPSFGVASSIMPISEWGYLFWTGVVALTVSAFLNARWRVLALFIGGVIYTWWGSLFLVTVIGDDHASLNGFALYYFVAFAHFIMAWRYSVTRPTT